MNEILPTLPHTAFPRVSPRTTAGRALHLMKEHGTSAVLVRSKRAGRVRLVAAEQIGHYVAVHGKFDPRRATITQVGAMTRALPRVENAQGSVRETLLGHPQRAAVLPGRNGMLVFNDEQQLSKLRSAAQLYTCMLCGQTYAPPPPRQCVVDGTPLA